MLKIKELTKVYKKGKSHVEALSKISITLPTKGMVALVGENGTKMWSWV